MSAALRTRAAVVLPVALLLGIVPAARAARQDAGPVARVGSISPYVDGTRPLRISVRVENPGTAPLGDVTLTVSVFGRISSRSQLRSALASGPSTGAVTTLSAALDRPIAPGGSGRLLLERPVGDVGAFRSTGVYPVRISVRTSDGETVWHSAIPVLRSVPETRVNVTWVLPVDRPTALRGDGTYDDDALAGLQAGLLRAQMLALAARPGLPVTLVPDGDLLDMLADLRDGATVTSSSGTTTFDAQASTARAAADALAAIRTAAGVVGEVASTTYTDADLSALTVNGLRSDVVRQLTASRRAIEEHLGRTPTFRFLVPDAATVGRAEMETITTLGVEHLLLDPATLPEQPTTPPDRPALRYDLFGPSRPVVVRSGQERAGALLIEPDLRARLEGGGPSVLVAQGLIAETAASWLEVPSLASERLLVIAGDDMPAPGLLTAALGGMAAAPWIQLRTASDALGALPHDGAPIQLQQRQPPDTPYLAEARRARDALGTLESLLVEPHPRAAEFDRMTLLAGSTAWDDDPAPGVALARAVIAARDEVVRGIGVARGRTVTLTSRTGALPVTVINQGGLPVRVRVRLESPKALFPQGDTATVDIDTQVTLDFEVETRAAGSFPVNVFVETIDGLAPLARGSIVMRSTAVSAVALAAIGGGIVVLVAASLRRRRRGRRASD